MSWFRRTPKSHDRIDVRMFDAASGELIHRAKLPIAQLPQSFEADTTLHLPDGDWRVLEARPMTASEFAATGELSLRIEKVGKIEMIDPREVLYSLPTIADALPAITNGTSKLSQDVVEIHEDDWRQIEFVNASRAEAIETELAAIRDVFENAREGPGFTRIHLRKQIEAPIDAGVISTDSLLAGLGPRATALAGWSFAGVAGLVSDGIAYRMLSSIELYGIAAARGGSVVVLGLTYAKPNNAAPADIALLSAFAQSHDLILVDWCRCQVVTASEAAYRAYFDERFRD